MIQQKTDEVLTTEEAARLLKISPYAMRDLARRNVVPARKVGKAWRFIRGSLLKWLEGQEKEHLSLEDRAWLETDLSRLGEIEPYDWGPQGVPKEQPIRYVPGVGPIVEGEKHRGR